MIPEELPAGNLGQAMRHILYCMWRFYRPLQDEERPPGAAVRKHKRHLMVRLRVFFPTLVAMTAPFDSELREIHRALDVRTKLDEQAVLWYLYSVCAPTQRYPTKWRLLKCYRPEDTPAYRDRWSQL